MVLVLVNVGLPAAGIAFESWWLTLLTLGSVVVAAAIVILGRSRVRRAPTVPPTADDRGSTRRFRVFESWTREQLLRPTMDNLDPTRRPADSGDAEPFLRAG